jgi:hypothetical protein
MKIAVITTAKLYGFPVAVKTPLAEIGSTPISV